jgi:hypothetical protein
MPAGARAISGRNMGPFSLAAIAAFSVTGSLAQPPAPRLPSPPPPPVRGPAHIPTAAEIAASVQSELPRALDGGLMVIAARAEGALLILTVEVPAAVGAMASDRFALNIARGFCQGPDAGEIFASGLRLRVIAPSAAALRSWSGR